MQKNKQRPGVMMYFHLVRPMKCLSKEQFSDLIWALLDYAEFGALPVFEDPMLQMSWGYLQHAADVDLERYEKKKKNARDAIEKRWHGTGDTNVYDGIPNIPNTNTKAEAVTNTKGKSKADADAHTNASASAKTQTNEQTPQSYEIPFHTGEDFQDWRERQIEAITEFNRNLREAAKAKKQNAC